MQTRTTPPRAESAPRPVRTGRSHVVAALAVAAITILLGACSGSTDVITTAADTTAAVATGVDETAAPATESASLSGATCDDLGRARSRLAGAAGSLFYVEDAELFEANGFEMASLQTDIKLWRPYQDVQPEVFGPIREGLDNLEHDLLAASEGRFTDMVRDYTSASMSAVQSTLCS